MVLEKTFWSPAVQPNDDDEIVLSSNMNMSSTIGLHGYGNTGWAASQAWRANGDQWFEVREVTGSNPSGHLPFCRTGVSFK